MIFSKRKALLFSFALLISLAVITSIFKGQPKNFPNIEVFSSENGGSPLNEFVKRETLIHIWTPWCKPCLKELKSLDQKAGTIPTIAITLNNSPNNLDYKKDYPNIRFFYTQSFRFMSDLKLKGLPSTLLVDHNLSIIKHFIGPQDWASIEL